LFSDCSEGVLVLVFCLGYSKEFALRVARLIAVFTDKVNNYFLTFLGVFLTTEWTRTFSCGGTRVACEPIAAGTAALQKRRRMKRIL
jgi:hypothetical protein